MEGIIPIYESYIDMVVKKIWDADIYRDGGSYGFCFDSDDGHWYEFFLQTSAFSEQPATTHLPPVIFFEGCNSGQVVQSFSWSEAQDFIAILNYENVRFKELRDIVANHGKKPDEAP